MIEIVKPEPFETDEPFNALPMNAAPSSHPSPPVGEKVPAGRLRGTLRGSWLHIGIWAALLLAGGWSSFARDFRLGMLPNAGQFSCGICHISPGGGGPRNSFGSDVESAIGFNLTAEFWEAVAGLDSDGDGFTNGQELGDPDGDGSPMAGAQITNPADPASRPASVPNTPPQVAITKPVDGAVFANITAIVLEASASDTGGSIASVAFRNGSTTLATKTSAPFTHTIPAGTLSAGTHALTAVATDNAGAATTSTPITITITAPNQAPTASIVQPAAGRFFLRSQVVRIEVTAGDADGSVARVEFLRGTNLLATVTSAPYVLLLETASLAPGTIEITARVVDDRGATTTSTPISFTLLSGLNAQVSVVKPSGTVELNWSMPAGVQLVVETSTNLTTWSQAGTVTSTAQGARFTETLAANSPRKFYRARLAQ